MHNSIKEKVLESIDIVEVVGERVALRRRGREFLGLCPFHPDHTPSLWVNPQKGIFKCFSCGAGGDAIKFVQLREKIGFREALESLARRLGIPLDDRPTDGRAGQMRDELRRLLEWARDRFQGHLRSPRGSHALDYARRRGLSDETIAKFWLGLATGDGQDLLRAGEKTGIAATALQQAGLVITNEAGRTYDRFRNRLIFPICDAVGRLVAFGGRTLGDDQPKYLNSPESALFSKSRVLYGLHLARRPIEQAGAAVIVEGYLDAVLLHQHGVENAIATLGTSLTDAHAKLLRPLAAKLVLCFDGDQPGIRAADRAAETALRSKLEVQVALMRDEKDPADCVVAGGRAAFDAVLAGAVDALQFKWDQTRGQFGSSSADLRNALEQFLRFIAEVGGKGGIDPLEQGVLVSRLSQTLGVPAEAVYEMLAAGRRRGPMHHTSDNDEVPETSGYDLSLRGVPSGLIAATEGLFGSLLAGAGPGGWDDATLAQAAGYVRAWAHLHALLRECSGGDGGLGKKEQVLANCDDAETCDLVGRCLARVAAADDAGETYGAARRRMEAELNLLRMGDLRGDLHRTDSGQQQSHEMFASLLALARDHHGVLPADKYSPVAPGAED